VSPLTFIKCPIVKFFVCHLFLESQCVCFFVNRDRWHVDTCRLSCGLSLLHAMCTHLPCPLPRHSWGFVVSTIFFFVLYCIFLWQDFVWFLQTRCAVCRLIALSALFLDTYGIPFSVLLFLWVWFCKHGLIVLGGVESMNALSLQVIFRRRAPQNLWLFCEKWLAT